MSIWTCKSDLLLVVDVQLDFCSDGALAVRGGEEVVSPINALMPRFRHVAATQDWHPPGHISFASSHPSHAPGDIVRLDYGVQTLWPEHCVQGTAGASFHPALRQEPIEFVLRKGFHPTIDSYSAFLENDRATPTGLAGYMRERGLKRVVCAGLALDYCVCFSTIDARRLGFEAVAVVDACRAIDQNGSLAEAIAAMKAQGVSLVSSIDIRESAS
jgi:nicotinamidase/pyrazinamidase